MPALQAGTSINDRFATDMADLTARIVEIQVNPKNWFIVTNGAAIWLL